MTTIAIVGAGPGLGLATARRFAKEGFAVALVSRSQEHVDALANDLTAEGLHARGYAASVRDPEALGAALERAASDLGPIEVLQYSPLPHKEFLRHVLESSREDLTAALEFSVLGPMAAVKSVLPGMRSLGRGSVLFVNGTSAIRPNPKYAGTSIAFAGESAYAQMLHDTLAPEGIHVAQLIIPRGIAAGDPTHDPAVLADRLWAIHTERESFRSFAENIDS